MAIKIKKKYRVVSAMNPKTGIKDLLRPDESIIAIESA